MMNMKMSLKSLIVAILIPLGVGGVSALISMGGMTKAGLPSVPFSPAGWVFPVVWTLLYTLMGISSYLVYKKDVPAEKKAGALSVYALQLFVNFLWPILFFNLRLYGFSFVWIILLFVLVLITAVRFGQISAVAGWLFVPYLLWLIIAGYLNLAIAVAN